MNERLDALLSARRDGVLDAAERGSLDRLLEASDLARRRALDFEGVDEQLRSLAASAVADPDADARLARNLASLRQRPEIASARRPPSAGARRRGRAVAWGIAAAVAAIWIASLLPLREGVAPEPAGPTVAGEGFAGSDLAALGIDRLGDLEVIEELELLEFLAARERSAEGPRG